MTIVTHEVLYKTLLPTLEKMFDDSYRQLKEGIEYHVRCRYGKYSIYKWEYHDGKRTSTTLAKGIDRELAVGMMKLLKEPK